MLDTLKRAWGEEEIRKKFYFTLVMLLIYRLGNNIPIPFIDAQKLAAAYKGMEGTLVDYLNMLTGGGLSTLSIFALGVQPYITASIVMQLLTVVIPRLEELTKEGEAGRKTIQKYTRYMTIFLAIFQAIAITNGLYGAALSSATPFQKIVMNVVLIGGTMLVTWMGETITEKGIGNGVSIIIFMGIIANVPKTLKTWKTGLHYNTITWISILIMALVVIFIVVFTVKITEGERKIPVQYAKRVVGRKMYGGQSTHIPVKVNMSGVMPIIFASAVLAIPSTISLFMGNANGGLNQFFSKSTYGFVIYLVVQAVLILVFAYFYNMIQFNTVEYGLNLSFGGSSVIIVVGVILETVKQIEAMLTMKNYKGFLNR